LNQPTLKLVQIPHFQLILKTTETHAKREFRKLQTSVTKVKGAVAIMNITRNDFISFVFVEIKENYKK